MPASFDDIVNLSKRRGFVFQSSEIYGGLRSAYDYGPVGVLLLRNVKEQWWKSMVQLRDDVVGLDSAILQARQVWAASGHEEVFTDPLVECTNCNSRHRLDKLDDPDKCPTCGTSVSGNRIARPPTPFSSRLQPRWHKLRWRPSRPAGGLIRPCRCRPTAAPCPPRRRPHPSPTRRARRDLPERNLGLDETTRLTSSFHARAWWQVGGLKRSRD